MPSKKQVETSLEAYRSLDPGGLRMAYVQIIDALREMGKGTYEQIAAKVGKKPEQIWKRLSEVGKMGLIYRTGEKVKMSSGRFGFVWAIKMAGNIDCVQKKNTLKKTPTVSDHSKAIKKIQKDAQQLTLF